MAAVEYVPRVFAFEPAPAHRLSLPPLQGYTSADTSFALPPLNDGPSGSDRLLDSLQWRKKQSVTQQRSSSPSSKGKEPAQSPDQHVSLVPTEEAEGIDWLALHLEESEGKAATGQRRTFKITPNDGILKLSSLGQAGAFEAFLAASAAGHSRGSKPRGNTRGETLIFTIDSADLLDQLVSATLGSTTGEAISWDKHRSRFHRRVASSRPEGLETSVAGSVANLFLDVATFLRRLEMIIDAQSVQRLTPTHHALLHTVSTYLAHIKARLSDIITSRHEERDGLWNKWTDRLSGIRRVLAVLCDMLYWPMEDDQPADLPSRASTLLNHVYGHFAAQVSDLVLAADEVSVCLGYILQYSSAPILHLLHQWLGLADSSVLDNDVDAASQPWSDLGISRASSRRRSIRHDSHQWEYTLSSKHMPIFVPKDNRRTIFEAGKSLRQLRQASEGGHPLCRWDWRIKASWAWAGDGGVDELDIAAHKRRIHKEIERWRRSGKPKGLGIEVGRIDEASMPQPPAELSPQPDTRDCRLHFDNDELWDVFDQNPGSHLANRKAASLWAGSPVDPLNDHLAQFLQAGQAFLPLDTPTLALFVERHIMSSLLTHSTLITSSLVSLYLDDLCLLDHLDILRSFWLGGDIGFAERVSGALFGKDEAGAGEALGMGRRARTRARLHLGAAAVPSKPAPDDVPEGEWGIGLGLGLSERAKWPPGGSELAYALRTTLVNQYNAPGSDRSEAWRTIEDRVSFALRDLPEDERDGRRARWMDPQAIEALDFLMLSYSPDEAIQAVLPQAIMSKYQAVHNFLLRICRVDTVLRSLYHDVTHSQQMPENEVKTGVDIIGRRTGLNRGSRVLQPSPRGMFSAHPATARQLELLRFAMTHFVSALHRYVLDTAIGTHWGKMRKRLQRLRRRVPGREDSRPATPLADSRSEYFESDPLDGTGQDEDGSNYEELQQLHSLQSLIVFHSATMDKILRACLLSDHTAHPMVYKVLMRMFGLVLDLGKAVKEVQRGVKSEAAGVEIVARVAKEWRERETSFLKAIKKLAARTTDGGQKEEREAEDGHDMRLLLEGDEADTSVERRLQSGGELQEFLLRLRLNTVTSSEVSP